MKRASLRYANRKALDEQRLQTGIAAEGAAVAAAAAATETLVEDAPALKAEADQNVEVEAGGEIMDENLDAVNEVIEDTAEAANPEAMQNEVQEGGEAPASAEGLEELHVDELLAVADEATGPDSEIEEIVATANGDLDEIDDEEPWYEDPKILLGIGAAALAVLLLRK